MRNEPSFQSEEAASLFESVPTPLAVLGRAGSLQHSNGALRSLLGAAPRHGIFLEIVSGPDRPATRAWLAQHARGSRETLEVSLVRADETVLPVRLEGRTYGQDQLIVTLTDLRDHRRLQAQVLQTQKLNALGLLASGIAHDFNNLLTAILACTSLLKYKLDREDLLEVVDEIDHAGDRAAALTCQLLSFSRQERVAPSDIDIDQVARSSERLLRRLLSASVDFRVRCEPDLPQIRADRAQLTQIVMNLVLNARDALVGKGVIELSFARRGHGIEITVTDNGVGIPADKLDAVFEPFYTTKSTGTGLGLATVHDVVSELGGQIAVHSEVGSGTVLRIVLPPAHAPAVVAVDAVAGPTILSVDDDVLLLETTARSLRELGYTVAMATTGAEALSWLRRNGAPDIILSDVVLPGGMSGPEFIERARHIAPGFKAIYMSGYTVHTLARHGFGAGEATLLRKPFTPRSLQNVLRQTTAHPRIAAQA